ncbi:uncharacterized protein LOC108681270 isoform X2 [Hyalella azteca]|uniref:Uncharacterized protein LOC108681270 isoform X2 n=1 Tax=Hyalella azteca TaxID=294128 RepID=A0A8B7PHZ6_HYAAZ|nr:uncharacterized protein LOC108681270 isoform X2 [Hyalella azteca]
MSLSQSCLLLAVSGDDAGSAELQQILHVPSQAFKSFNVLTHVHYVRVPLSQKTFCIAKLASAVGVSEIRSKSIPGNFKVFPARCCFSVTGGSEWDGKTTLVAATDIKILKKTSIKSVCVKVLLKSKNDVINMEKNTNLYLKVIENIISSYGIVSHCVIRCHYNTLAQVFGIRKIFICSMKSCNNQSSSCSNFNDSFDCVGVKFNDSSNTRQIELELKQGTSPCGCSESCFRANPERLQRSNGRVTVCSVAQEDQLSNSQTNYSINLHEAIMQQGLTVQDKSLEKLFIAQKTEGLLLLVIGLSGWGKTSLLHRVAMTARTPVVSIDCRTMKPNIDAIFQMKTQLPTERPGLLLLRRLDTLFAASKKPDHIINEIVGAILCYLQQKGVCVVVTAPDIGSLPPDLVALPYIELNVGSSTVPYRRAILRHFLADYNLADYKAGAHEMPADYAPKRSLVDSYPSQEHKLPGSCSLSTRRNSIEPELSYNMIGDDPSGSQQFEVDVDSIYSVTTRDASPKYDIKSGSPVDVITDSVRNLNLNDKDSEQMSSSKSMCSEVVALNPASSKERLTHQIQLAEGSIADQLARITPGYVASDIQDLLSLGQEKLLITGEEAISPADMMSAAVEELRTFRPRVLRSSELLGDRPVAHTLGGLEYLQELLSDILKITVSGADEDLSLLGVKPTRGVLLYGPPGCGKTQLICRLASSKGCAFFAIQPKHILSIALMWESPSKNCRTSSRQPGRRVLPSCSLMK